MMRGTPGMRLALAILSPIFLVLCFVAIRRENVQPWARYQQAFSRLYADRASAKLREAEARGDGPELRRWRRVVDEVSHTEPEMAQIYLEELQVADRCTTCHRGIDNPLFQDAPEPFRTHPGELLKRHDPGTFGCTPCHEGQGGAVDAADAHGRDGNWLEPMLPTAYLQASCARCHEVTHGVRGAELASRGADLFLEKGCYGCHVPSGVTYLPKFGPPLAGLKSKLRDAASWTHAWIKDPASINRDTAMPKFRLDDEEAGEITAFLMSLPADPPYQALVLDGASAKEGERLFVERGCRGCHAVEPDDHSVSPRVPHLAGIGSKATPEWLDRWIADPKVLNPDTAMPRVELKDTERRALVAYLQTLTRSAPVPPAPDLSRFDPENGRRLVVRYECFGCHAIPGFERRRPSVPDLGEFARKPIDDLDFGRAADVPRTKWDWLLRKLRDPNAYEADKIELLMPRVAMTEEEERALVTYVLGLDRPTLPARYAVRASPEQRARRDLGWMVAHLSCNGCHRVNERDPRIARFLDRSNATPPPLDGVATRLPSHEIYKVVLEPRRARPWLGMQMPSFGLSEAQAQALVDGFASAAGLTNVYAEVPVLNIVGPTLTALPKKVADPSWLVAWLSKPSRLRPGTAMPDPDLQPEEIQQVVKYLYASAAPESPNEQATTSRADGQWQGSDPDAGAKLFVSRGCRGCHAISPDDKGISSRVPNLAGVGLKVRGSWLFSYLKSPRSYDAHTPMPHLELPDGEIRDLVAYLLSRRTGAEDVAAAPRFDPSADAAAGRDAIERYGCAKCHEVKGFPTPPPAVVLASETPTISRETTLRNGRVLVELFQCRGCHEIEGSGGAIAAHLDLKTLAPPKLDGEGARVQTTWLVDFLRKPTHLRPWLELRMPNYEMADGHARALARYFAALAGVPAVDEPRPGPQEELAARGLRRLAHFHCTQCHPVNPSPELPEGLDKEDASINLVLSKTRLRPSWIREFLARPKAIAGMQTRMPTVFYTVEGAPKVAHPEEDIEAITSFLFNMVEPPDVALAQLKAEQERERASRDERLTDWTTAEY